MSETTPTPAPRLALPPLNDDLVEILGRMCFHCINLAEVLRRGGAQIPHRAENEQAASIHFLLGVYLEHGPAWSDKANEQLNAILKANPLRSPP